MKVSLIFDKPKDCGHCRLSDFVDGDVCMCRMTSKRCLATDNAPWCPATELMSEEEQHKAVPVWFIENWIKENCIDGSPMSTALRRLLNEWKGVN